jgi:hypothetical protein
MKCIVKDCINQTHEGLFIGELCAPCHEFVTKGNGVYSQVYRNTQRQWVGLTDEERTEIRREHYARTLPLMDAVEAKLKEKNT